jgi:hypothetical protein
MSEPNVTCPKCGHEFPLTTALTADIEATFQSRYAQSEKELRASFDRQLDDAKELANIEAKRQAAADAEAEIARLRSDLSDRQEKLATARQIELELRKAQRELEDQKAELALEVERRISAERGKLTTAIEQRLQGEHANKEREKDLQLASLRRQVEDMQRRLQQGSQQVQGEASEIRIEDALRAAFNGDSIDAVAKGIRGADLCQRVTNPLGQGCGVIVWEVKNTKSWNPDWLQKLKDDMQVVKGDVAVLVSTSLPNGVRDFALIDGVWVTSFDLAIPLAVALRAGMMEVAAHRRASVGKNEKMEILFAYLTGNEFRQRITSTVETFRDMKDDLEGEKRAIQKLWAKRDKQLDRVAQSITAMFGDLQGIAGQALPDIDVLQLPPATEA